MKRVIARCLIAGTIAAAVVLLQWLWVHAGDTFEVIQHGDKYYKVFTWAFPFRIVDCNPVLGIATPRNEIPLRLAGNLVFFFAVVIALTEMWRQFRTTITRAQEKT